MALTLANLRAQMERSLLLLGAPDTNGQTDILCGAVGRFISRMDRPIISADLAIVADTATYDVPSTIDKVRSVRNASKVVQDYTWDAEEREITFSSTPTAGETGKVWGTPKDVRTNLETVIAAIDENDEFVLWAYVVAFAHSWAHSDQFALKLKEADKYALEHRRSKNRVLDMDGVPIKHRDARGYVIDHSSNAAGYSVNVSDNFAPDL